MMHRLKIIREEILIEFPKTSKITHGGNLEGTETQMADGSIAFDVIGFRANVTYVYDYLPQGIFDTLIPLLRKYKFLTAKILDVNNTEKEALFKVDYPKAEAFKLTKEGTAVWHNVTIKLTAKDVET